MPKLSYPKGRTAAARMEAPEEKLKSSSVNLTEAAPSPVEEEDQPEVVVQEDDASAAFQKQIDALRESERLQKERISQVTQEREDAIRRANEHQAEVTRLKKSTAESQAGEISASLAAATGEAEAAQRDIEKALELGDFKGQADAYRRLSKAETNIARLEDGKSELETQAKAQAEVRPQVSGDPLDNTDLPPLAKDWLRSHPDYLTSPRKNAKIQALHWDIVDDEGHAPFSAGYFTSMEEHLGIRKRQEQIVIDDEPEERTRSVVSAPVSREVPTSASGERPGTVRLSVAQKEAAKIAGISEKEYAEQVLRLRSEKSNGHYGGQP